MAKVGKPKKASKVVHIQKEEELSITELESVAGGATLPIRKKPKGNGTGPETHDPNLKLEPTKPLE